MDRRLIGYIVSSFGLGVLTSSIVYPLGYMESEDVFRTMVFIGNTIIVLGVFIRATAKRRKTNITLDNIQNKMYEIGFNKEFADEIMVILEKKFNNFGEQKFRKWFSGLNYRTPEEFEDELFTIKIYEKHSLLIEEQVKELEKETKLSWEIQTEDIKNIDEKAKKVQLVIRDRLSSIALDLLN